VITIKGINPYIFHIFKKDNFKTAKMRPTCICFGVTNPKDKPNQRKSIMIQLSIKHLISDLPVNKQLIVIHYDIWIILTIYLLKIFEEKNKDQINQK